MSRSYISYINLVNSGWFVHELWYGQGVADGWTYKQTNMADDNTPNSLRAKG